VGQALKPFDVVCFGEILWDIFEAGRRSAPSMARTFRAEPGGAPANVAIGLARLGVRSALSSAVGQDWLGRGLTQRLKSERVSTDFIIQLPNRTGITFVVRDGKGEPSFLSYRHGSADLAMTAKHVTSAMGRTKWGLVGSSTLLTPSLARATKRFLDQVRAHGGLVFVDLNVRTHLWPNQHHMRRAIAELLKRAHVVKASEADLAALGGRRGLRWLEAHAKRAARIVTHGAKGAVADGEFGRVAVPATRVRTVDATGAGDAFTAGVLAALVEAEARPDRKIWNDASLWTRALEAGNLMGAKAVGRVGAVTGLTRLARVRRLTSAREQASPGGI
jgi:fructokinase